MEGLTYGEVAPVIALVVVWLVIALIIVSVVKKIIQLLTIGLTGSKAFGEEARDRLIGFAFAAILCWKVVPWLWYRLVRVVLLVTAELPRNLMGAYGVSSQACDNTTEVVCTKAVLVEYIRASTSVVAQFISELFSLLPYISMFVFLVIWALAAQGLAALRGQNPADYGPLARGLAAMKPVTRSNTLLMIILGAAMYFSLASMAAIPWLTATDAGSEATKPERLREQLEAEADPVVGEDSKVNPFEVAERAVNDALPPSDEAAAAPPTATVTNSAPATDPAAAQAAEAARDREMMLDALKRAMTDATNVRTRAINLFKDVPDDLTATLKNAREDAVNQYTQSVETRKGGRERVIHYHQLVAWYQNGRRGAYQLMRDCERSISQGDQAAHTWAFNVVNLLRRGGAPRWWEEAAYGSGVREMYDSYYRSYEVCRAGNFFEALPERERMGNDLGPFRVVAQWLVQTESLPLTLIVGLIGFGLLGSAASTFVREKAGQRRAAGTPLVEDLGGVVIRGVSAAIVVFLAVKGGLIIFSGEAVDPNPYILLLTCLIAAVFSENVWEWARQKLLERLAARRDEEEEERQAEAEPPAAKPVR